MNMMEMVLAMFAVVFFTTIAMVYNQAMWDQAELLDNAGKYVQASHLAHSVLDEIDAKLFSKQLAFNNVKTSFNNSTRVMNLAHTGGTYNLAISAVDSDSLGVPLSTAVTNNIYVRVLVTVTTTGLAHPVTMKRIYTKTHLNI
ncbi:MAG: hypothetical protein U1C33_06780 [Candidatus Cloacimonadaceae bacterium]|nr:hypothetical protein [Candidatus Cloacimonadaceae bacterium]